jgi:outer membrane biosynthesis protein TonB
VDKVLTVGRLNTYLLRGGSNIVAVDNKTGVVHWMRNIRPGAFAFFLVNPMDDKIYLVKADGETQAIREQRLTTGAPAPAPAPKPATTPAPAPAPEATPAPAPAPEATPAPAPEATPAPTPAPEATPAPAPEATPAPTPAPEAAPAPAPAP